MTHIPRVVFDTNAVLAALLFVSGRLVWLRRTWREARIIPLASQATIAELVRVLAYPKFKLALQERQELLADYLPYCEVVQRPSAPTQLPAVRDSGDRPFLELAIAGKADYLVTGDEDLLSIAETSPCPVVSPVAFEQVLKG